MTREQLIAELERTRQAMIRNGCHLKDDLDIGAKIRGNIAQNAGWWVTGAAITGFLLSGRKSPKPAPVSRKHKKPGAPVVEEPKKRTALSLVATGARIAFPLLKPILSAYAAKGVAHLAGRMKHEHQ